MNMILAHEQLMDNLLASSMSGMLTGMICDRIARSIRERVMNVLAEDALAPCHSRRRPSCRWRYYSTFHDMVGIGPRS